MVPLPLFPLFFFIAYIVRNKQAMIASLSAGQALGGAGQQMLFLWCCIRLYVPFVGVELCSVGVDMG